MKADWFGVEDGLVLVEEGDVFRDAVLEDEDLLDIFREAESSPPELTRLRAPATVAAARDEP